MQELHHGAPMPPGRHAGASRPAVVVTQLLLSVLGLAALAYSGFFAWRYFSSPAWFDLWYWVEDFTKWTQGHYGFRDLIRAQSEHRIATTRLLLLIDSLYFGMSGRFVAVINGAGFLLLGLLLWRLAMQGVPRRAAGYVPGVAWAAFIAGTCQFENLMLAFQVQFVVTCCCALGAVWLFAAACDAPPKQRNGIVMAALGAGLALLAVFSMGSGILLLPALIVLLWLRRAPRGVWAVFALWAVISLALELPVYFAVRAPVLPPHTAAQVPGALKVLALRALFSAGFLGSAVNGVPGMAIWVGFAGFAALLAFAAVPVWRRWRGGAAVAAPDAALLALAIFAAACGPAASVTLRLMLGTGAAVASRYATMSLLFWAAIGGLLLRRRSAAGADAWWERGAIVLAAAGLLYLVNLPSYAVRADYQRRSILAEAGLLANNIGVAGPIDVIFFNGVPRIRAPARFLHDAGLNIFAPGQGPPAELLARLAAAAPGSLPACRGSVDQAMAIDSGAVLLNGWLAGPDGHHTAPWIAVRDAAGRVAGTARALEERRDLTPEAGFKPPAYGFTAGFRDAADGPRQLKLDGIFPDRPVKLCELAAAVDISGVLVQPIAELPDLRPRSLAGPAVVGPGFKPGYGGAPLAVPGLGPQAVFASGGGTLAQPNAVEFPIAAGGPDSAALVLPFWTPPGAGLKSATFVLADHARLAAPLGPWWGRGFWRAAVLPAALARVHGGAVRVEVRDAGGGALTVAAPMVATERPGWSRLF